MHAHCNTTVHDLVLKLYPICKEKHTCSVMQLPGLMLMIRRMLHLIPELPVKVNGHEKDPSQAIVMSFSRLVPSIHHLNPSHTYVDRVKQKVKASVNQEIQDTWNT